MEWLNRNVSTNKKRNNGHFPLLYKVGICCILIIFILHYYCQGSSSDTQSSSTIFPSEYFEEGLTLKQNISTNTSDENRGVSLARCDQKFGKVVLKRAAYPQDPACRNFTKCLYENDSFKQTPLVSFPGSGNTWTRHLIELVSGIFTGSIYTDIDLLSRGFIGEKEPADAGSTIVQKMHIHYSEDLNVSRAILLIRDPYKAIVSFVQYMESGHLGLASVHTFRKKEWPVYILGKTFDWISIAKSWIEAPVDLLVLHYENLQGKYGIRELEKVCNFLQINCCNLHTRCFQNHKEGLFHRRKKFIAQPTFPNWVQRKVNRGINYLNTLLTQYGHSSLPLHKYQYQPKQLNVTYILLN